MRSTLWWLGLIFGTLSVVMLMKHGFDYGFAAPLQLILDYYERMIGVLLGWAEPWIKLGLADLRKWLGWSLELNPHWKYLMVLMWLYFGADARVDFQRRDWDLLATTFCIGGPISLAASVLFGAFPKQQLNEVAWPILVPVLAMALYEVARSVVNAHGEHGDGTNWGRHVLKGLGAFAIPEVLIGALVVAFIAPLLQRALPKGDANLSLAAFAVFMVILAIYWVFRSSFRATFNREPSETWRERFARSGSQQAGFGMLRVMIASAAFVGLNAGLQFLGL